MRIIRIAERKYPRYVAEQREGRLKGQYPRDISMVPSLRRQWDHGGFGTGTRLIEWEADSPQELIRQLWAQHINPRYDEIEFFEIAAPGSPRVRLSKQHFFHLLDHPVN